MRRHKGKGRERTSKNSHSSQAVRSNTNQDIEFKEGEIVESAAIQIVTG